MQIGSFDYILSLYACLKAIAKKKAGGGEGREEGYFRLSPNSLPFDFFCAANYSLRLSHYLKAWKRQP